MATKVQKAIVLYYADWCRHCEKFKPIWNKIKEQYKNNKGIKFLEYEATKHPDIMTQKQISGFPTIRAEVLVKYKNGKEVVDYDDFNMERTVENMDNFVQQLSAFSMSQQGQIGGGRSGVKLHRNMLRMKIRMLTRMYQNEDDYDDE